MSHSEQMIENQFIQILSEKENQWTYRPDLKSEEALWQNFRGHEIQENDFNFLH